MLWLGPIPPQISPNKHSDDRLMHVTVEICKEQRSADQPAKKVSGQHRLCDIVPGYELILHTGQPVHTATHQNNVNKGQLKPELSTT